MENINKLKQELKKAQDRLAYITKSTAHNIMFLMEDVPIYEMAAGENSIFVNDNNKIIIKLPHCNTEWMLMNFNWMKELSLRFENQVYCDWIPGNNNSYKVIIYHQFKFTLDQDTLLRNEINRLDTYIKNLINQIDNYIDLNKTQMVTGTYDTSFIWLIDGTSIRTPNNTIRATVLKSKYKRDIGYSVDLCVNNVIPYNEPLTLSNNKYSKLKQ